MLKKKRKIFERTDGECHICRNKLVFSNYGKLQGRGIWEVEHSNPKANGGSDRLVNKYAACVSCNRSKGASSTQQARAKHGYRKAPYSQKKKIENVITGGAIGLISWVLVPPPTYPYHPA